MKLYEITKSISDVIESGFHLDEETGEFFDPTDLDRLQVEFLDKADGVACYIKSLRAFASSIRDEEKALAERRRAVERRADSLASYLDGSMAVAGVEKVDSPRCKVSFRTSKAVEILDEGSIPSHLMRVKEEPNKQLIKKALEAGEEVPGAAIVINRNMQIK